MKPINILLLLLIQSFISGAQEITNLIILSDDEVGLAEANDIYRDGDRNYFILAGNSLLDMDLGIDMSEVENLPLVSWELGDTLSFGKSFLFEYGVGGILDYTSMSRFINDSYSAVDGDLMAYAFNSPMAWFDNQEIFGGEIFVYDEFINNEVPFRNDLAVYDKLNDTLLWHYHDHDDYIHNLQSQAIDIDGDYLYYAMTFLYPHPFMGDSLQRTDTVYQGINYSSVFHKINWRTNEKLWSYNMASEVLPDEIRQVKVLDDGSVMLAIESYGPFTWDGEVLDPDHMYGSPFGGYYNIVLAHISADGAYINHVHLWSPGNFSAYDVQIESDGNVYAYGVIFTGDNDPGQGFVEVHGDSIRFDSGSYGTGNLMAFDKDLDLRWSKEYGGSDRVHVTSTNELLNGEVIVNIRIFEDVVIDGVLYENEYFDNEFFGEPDPLEQNFILHYDRDGELISKPLPFGDSFDTREILELAENKYLFLLRNYQREYSTPTFFDREIALYDARCISIMEVEGNFLESVTAVNEIDKAIQLKSFPNPITNEGSVMISIPEKVSDMKVILEIYDIKGQKQKSINISRMEKEIELSNKELNRGINTILIRTQGNLYITRIVKN